MKKIKFLILKGIVSFFGVGFLKFAPGTFGSLSTVFLWLFVMTVSQSFNIDFLSFTLALIIIIFFMGLLASHYYMKETNNFNDPQEIVIDEVVGQLLSFLLSFSFLPFIDDIYSVAIVQNKVFLIFFYIITPFLLFRLFDIKKPLLVGYFDKKKSAMGVMMDDVFAGIYAGLTNAMFIFLIIKCFSK